MKAVKWIVAGAVAAALAGCGAEEIASPGSGGSITINNPPPVTPPPTEPDPEDDLVTPAASCPTITNTDGQLTDRGTITGPTGTYRVCELPTRFTANTTLARVPGLLYSLAQGVPTHVGYDLGPTPGVVPAGLPAGTAAAGVALTIQPGVIIFANPGATWLAVNRGNRILAVGTAAKPIIFTSKDNVTGFSKDTNIPGEWGGVVLMGRAPITDCATGTPGAADCIRTTEGDVDQSTYGGATANDNSGELKYVQIRYSGFILSSNFELQSLTLEGVGSATKVSYIHSHNSSDDGFENFGGTVDMRYLVLTGADDDSIDIDTGYQGTIQYVIAAQKSSGGGDSVIELDSANGLEAQEPRTFFKMANFTLLHRNAATGNGAAMRFRGQANVALVNGLVSSPMSCLMIEKPEFLTTAVGGSKVVPSFQSVGLSCGGATPFRGVNIVSSSPVDAFNADVSNWFAGGANNSSSLTGPFVIGPNTTTVTAIDPKTVDSRFDTATYVGAVKDASDTWYAGWTCNSAYANFGTTSGSCTSLPSLED